MSKRVELGKMVPEMDYLIGDDTIPEGLKKLHGLVDEYEDWIKKSEKSMKKTPSDSILSRSEIQERISQHIIRAEDNAKRMREGIGFLQEDKTAREAFILANASIKISQNEPGVAEVKERLDENGDFIPFKWYPFQIAFILLNLKGLCALESDDPGRKQRGIVDLAWFPTGGGKTEAYLGLIAMIGFYRRLRFPHDEVKPSTHVVMRYTLRLLTSDQADRLVRLVVGMN